MSYRYDVALSFAGEDRAYAQGVADALRANNVVVFYDQYETVRVWGADLVEFMDDVYRNGARYVMVFLSEHYARKPWTMHEKRSIQARVVREGPGCLLPVLLDDTEIPGLLPTIGAVDGRERSPRYVAELTIAKLATDDGPLDRSPGWEYVLLADAIRQSTERLRTKRLDHELRYAAGTGRHVADAAVAEVLTATMDELATATAKLDALFGPGRLEWATGRPGEPGDATRIEHLGGRFGTTYEEILDWAARVRGTVVATRYRRAFELLARLADEPVRWMQRFVDDMVTVGGVIAASPGDITVEVALTLDFDEGLLKEFHAEVERAK